MEQAHKIDKARDLASGFFGWFVIGNLVLWLWFSALDYLNSNASASSNWRGGLSYFGVPLVTIIVIGILFFLKRNWVAYGILIAVVINTLLLLIILGSVASSPTAEKYIYLVKVGVSYPLPLGLAVFMQ
jgi:hypothetical protein